MTYRNDDAALERRRELERRLREATEPGGEAIRAELASIDRERIEAARRRLPLVARAQIASPCSESWETMAGDGAVRACSRCDKEVFDLSLMTLGQAEALIASRVGQETCARIFQRPDGTMMFLDCEVGPRGVLQRRVGAFGVAAAIGGAALAWINAPPPRPPLRLPTYTDTSVLFMDPMSAPAYRGGQMRVAAEPRPLAGELTLDGTDVLVAAVSHRRQRILSCYDHVRETAPELAGAITLSPVIDAEGAIADASLVSDTLESAEVLACVVRTLRRIRFSPAPNRSAGSEVTLTFAPPAAVLATR